MKATWTKYTYSNPEALPIEAAEVDDFAAVVTAAGADPQDEETAVCRLTADWNGHAAGTLVVTGLTSEGHEFAVAPAEYEK